MATTSLSAPPAPLDDVVVSARRALPRVQDAAVIAALGWWGTGLTFHTGGREPHVLSYGLVLLALALVAVQPWKSVPALAYAALCAAGLGAYAVTAVSATGWAGANEAASWVYATQLGAVVYVWGKGRPLHLLTLLTVAPTLSFCKGWTAWWAGNDPTRLFVGTFYWHNQQAVFMVIGVLAGTALLISGERLLRVLGVLGVALCGAGVLVTTSRASMMAAGAGLGLLLALALVRQAWGAAVTVGLMPVLIGCTAAGMTGPPFFSHWVSPFAGTSARAGTGQSVATNGGYRLDDWRAALQVFAHRPLEGAGFHGFAAASKSLNASGVHTTAFAHNGFLQILVDGGLLLGIPCAAVGLVLLAVLRSSLLPALRTTDWPVLSGLVIFLVSMLHSAIDFDWTYPTLLAAVGVVTALVASSTARRTPAPGRWFFGALALGLVLVSIAPAWHGALSLNVGLGSNS